MSSAARTMATPATLAALCAALIGAGGTAAGSPIIIPGQPKPWLGISIQDARGGGVLIAEVIRGTPADAAGLEVGDVVLSIDQARVRTRDELIETVQDEHEIGEDVEVTYLRFGTQQSTRATLTGMPDDGEMLYRRLVDEPAPGFTLEAAQTGKRTRLSELRGKVVVLEFFSASMTSAVDSLSPLTQLVAAHRGDVAVLGISGDSPASLRTFAGRHGVLFPLLYDFAGTTRARYRVAHAPALIVIDRDGVVRYAGYGSGANLDDAIFAALRALRAGRGLLRDTY